MWDKISELWCKIMHDRTMWPIHGRYICPDCMREYAVEWEHPRQETLEYDAPLYRVTESAR
jgi:acetone carboxylase gamma subunit